MKGRSNRLHYAVECTPDGQFSYLLCRGFPSVGKHTHVPEEAKGEFHECAQCKKILDKMFRQRPHLYVLLDQVYNTKGVCVNHGRREFNRIGTQGFSCFVEGNTEDG